MPTTAPQAPSPLRLRPTPTHARRTATAVRLGYAASLLIGDIAAISLAFLLAYQLHSALEERPTRIAPVEALVPTALFLAICILVTFTLYRLYLPRRGTSRVDELGALLLSVTVANIGALALSAFTRRGLDVPQQILGYAWALSILFCWLVRTALELGLQAARRAGLDGERVLIIGSGDRARLVDEKIAAAPSLGYQVVGFIDDHRPVRAWGPRGAGAGADATAPRLLGGTSDLADILRRYPVTQVVVADPTLSHAQILDLVAVCDRARLDVFVVPDVFHLVVQEVSASELGGMPLLRVRDVGLRGWNLLVKRAMDIALSTLLLVGLAPILVGVALIIKLTSPGPVFYIQERVGIDGRRFPCVKFRSMRHNAEAATGPVWATPDDDRTTSVGRVLRRYSLDELPQLVNVLLGDMSLVGPRPERPHFVEQFSRLIPRYDKRHQEKAGLTGWAQVNGLRGQAPIEERTWYDLYYVERWSPAFDLKILLKTVAAVLRGHDAY